MIGASCTEGELAVSRACNGAEPTFGSRLDH